MYVCSPRFHLSKILFIRQTQLTQLLGKISASYEPKQGLGATSIYLSIIYLFIFALAHGCDYSDKGYLGNERHFDE